MGNLAVAGHQSLGRLAACARAELDLGAGEVGVDGLGRDAQAQGDLLAAVALDHVAKTIPLAVGEKLKLRSLAWTVECFPHAGSIGSPERKVVLKLRRDAHIDARRVGAAPDCLGVFSICAKRAQSNGRRSPAKIHRYPPMGRRQGRVGAA
jgi:hypothetical protein